MLAERGGPPVEYLTMVVEWHPFFEHVIGVFVVAIGDCCLGGMLIPGIHWFASLHKPGCGGGMIPAKNYFPIISYDSKMFQFENIVLRCVLRVWNSEGIFVEQVCERVLFDFVRSTKLLTKFV